MLVVLVVIIFLVVVRHLPLRLTWFGFTTVLQYYRRHAGIPTGYQAGTQSYTESKVDRVPQFSEGTY